MDLIKNANKFAVLLFASVILQTIHITGKAQKSTSSPYSRFGVGNVTPKGFAQGFALGGSNIALQNDTTAMQFINTGNPASYATMRLTIAELGANLSQLKLESATATQTVNNASVGYLSLAFPIQKWWGTNIGLQPYSSVGYSFSEQQSISNVGNVEYLYEGDGGINQVYWGNGIKPFFGLPKAFLKSKKYERLKLEKKDSIIYNILKRKKSWQNLSLGVNASYLFGGISQTQSSIFDLNSNALNISSNTTSHVGDFYFDYGVQYKYIFDSIHGRDIKENVQLLLGATFSAESNINFKMDSLAYSYIANSAGDTASQDVIINSEGTKGELTLPVSFGFGIGFKKGERWLVGADFSMQNWSDYKVFNNTQGLKNSMRTSLGIRFIPKPKANGKMSFFKRTHYRIGGRYALTSIEANSTQLTETAVSFGLGLPVSRNYLLKSFSMVNIGIEIGQRGTTENGLIKESFFNTTIGFTINDKWFTKRKYD